jgi:hypothetical protein
MTFPITSRSEARLAAQAIVRNKFVATATCEELQIGVATYAKLAADPLVQHEVEKILNRTERNASRFLDLMWDWMEADAGDDKLAAERKVSAARILAKGYISEKSAPKELKPMVIEGLEGANAIANLTGDGSAKVQ